MEKIKPSVLFDARWFGFHGIGRFAQEIATRLPNLSLLTEGLPLLHPFEPLWLLGQILKRKPVAFMSPGFNPPLWSSVPFVFVIHDLIHLRFPEESSFSKRLYYQFVVRPAAHRAYRVLTVSSFSKKEIMKWTNLPEEQVVVVGNGVGMSFSPTGNRYQPGYPYLLYVGSQKPHKNIERMLIAFARSGVHQEGMRLLCTGRATTRLQGIMRRWQIEKFVEFLGVVPEHFLASLYRGAQALLIPSMYEGFGLPAVEAMACGTPVIASNVASLPEVVGDAALLVNPYDVEAIARGIRRLSEDRELQDTLREKGLERARLFSWDKVAARVEEVLCEALEEA